MKALLIKYTAEFFIIILGISASFYLENQNALDYKESLKNQSLQRIQNNLKVDQVDLKYNIGVHQLAIKACNWLILNHENLEKYSNDSVGYYLGLAIISNTMFVDNQEEYRALQGSGLIELIENDEIVKGLQNKYATHAFLKDIERYILEDYKASLEFLLANTILYGEDFNEFGYPYQRKYISKDKIPQSVIERIKVKNYSHKFYLDRIENRIKKDEHLEKLIVRELQ
jgi:hypothetical protein